MKRIIDDYIYDTEISEMIFLDEEKRRRYYQTPNKRFFVVLVTGELMVVSDSSMREILGRYDVDKYIEVFGEPKEG